MWRQVNFIVPRRHPDINGAIRHILPGQKRHERRVCDIVQLGSLSPGTLQKPEHDVDVRL